MHDVLIILLMLVLFLTTLWLVPALARLRGR